MSNNFFPLSAALEIRKECNIWDKKQFQISKHLLLKYETFGIKAFTGRSERNKFKVVRNLLVI